MEIEDSKWFNFFDSLLKASEKFELKETSEHGYTHQLKYESKLNQTQIEIGIYNTDDTLIYIKFFNPKTPGLTKYQENEYFYRDQFRDNGYGPVGLEFLEINKSVFEEFLLNGLNGKEVQYFVNSKLYKADLSFEKNKLFFNHTVYFEKQGCLSLFFPKRSERNLKFQLVEIIYDDIFTLCSK